MMVKVGATYIGFGNKVRVRVVRTNPLNGEKWAVLENPDTGKLISGLRSQYLVHEAKWSRFKEVV